MIFRSCTDIEVSESAGEQLVRASLNFLRLPFKSQYVLPSLSNRYYDFVVRSPDQQIIFIEWDGEQHFKYVPMFHYDQEGVFFEGQEVDIIKTREVITHNYKMVRIDYTWLSKSVDEVGQFILQGIQSSQSLVLSTPVMYDWLTRKVSILSEASHAAPATPQSGALIKKIPKLSLKIRR